MATNRNPWNPFTEVPISWNVKKFPLKKKIPDRELTFRRNAIIKHYKTNLKGLSDGCTAADPQLEHQFSLRLVGRGWSMDGSTQILTVKVFHRDRPQPGHTGGGGGTPVTPPSPTPAPSM